MKKGIILLVGMSLALLACDSNSNSRKDYIDQQFLEDLTSPRVVINEKELEFDVVKDGNKGFNIQLDFNIHNMKDKQTKVIVYFEQPKGTGLEDKNGEYCTKDGHVCVSKSFTPSYDNSNYNISIFMPNKEIHMKKGKLSYYCNIRFLDTTTGEFIDKGNTYLSFKGTKNDDDYDDDYNNGGGNYNNNDGGEQGDQYYNFNAGGYGNMEMWVHPDGSSTVKTQMMCHSCRGSKRCNICNGTGNGYAMINSYMPCPACGATGVCGTCKGNGFIVQTKKWAPGEAEAYLQAHREVKAQSRHERSSSYSGGSDNRYIETIEYAPNYTGESNDEWCEKCHKYAPAHSHIKKRIPD